MVACLIMPTDSVYGIYAEAGNLLKTQVIISASLKLGASFNARFLACGKLTCRSMHMHNWANKLVEALAGQEPLHWWLPHQRTSRYTSCQIMKPLHFACPTRRLVSGIAEQLGSPLVTTSANTHGALLQLMDAALKQALLGSSDA